jgi:protein involved in polysaccharide export with SLBB domain
MLLIFVAVFAFGCSSDMARQAHSDSSQAYIYVRGDFKQPGRFVWMRGMSVVDAVHLAGGVTAFSGSNLYVYHSDGSHQTYQLASGTDFTNVVTLSPGDEVRSPAGRLW